MRSIFSRIIAVAACIPLIAGVWKFIDVARATYGWEGLAVSQETFSLLSEGLVTPIMLFGVAAIVEMLFRIAEKPSAPRPEGPSRLRAPGFWPWRNAVANLVLVGAVLIGIASAWSVIDVVNAMAQLPDAPTEQFPSVLVRGFVDAVINMLVVVGLAAAIEYLSRIAAASQRASENPG